MMCFVGGAQGVFGNGLFRADSRVSNSAVHSSSGCPSVFAELFRLTCSSGGLAPGDSREFAVSAPRS
ncbi:unnamed protein product [Caenorhabditis auriculariae]|uniref:Uncharacterized protein n=1 Tax=Caenorhabditis auriculariae TaxID=2777116 RepID=A0A8S1GRI5_9PELO|nr:unnamed protein product [Caenorhabditis auriculariae]